MRSKIILFLVAFLVWSILNWMPDWQHLFVGIFVAFFVSFLTADLFVQKGDSSTQKILRRSWYFISLYLPRFLWECVKANVDVAWRVLHPKLPINPGIIKVKTSLKSDTALTFLANSITLTPGTLSVDIDKDNAILYVHWIDVKAEDVESATEIIVQRFEKILKKIFD
jgi:multicomponent Na+:H+ antiporter subunit E